MSRNGSGTYTAPASSWNPAVNGALASYTDWNSLLADISAALTQSLSADGQTPVSGNLNMNGNKLTSLAAGTGTGQSLRWEQLFSQGTEIAIASAATVDIGAQNTNFLNVTGTTTITSFGTNYNGPRFLRFSGAVTLTNSSTLILPGGANITTAAGDTCIVIPKATAGTADGWQVVAYQKNAAPGVIPDGSVTYAKLSSDLQGATFGFKNRLINAQGLINQRGYVSGTATSGANQYTVDRWRVVTSGQNLTFTTTNNVTTFTAPAGGVEQVIEGLNLESGTYVLSWTGTATAKVAGTTVTNGGTVTVVGGTNTTVQFASGTFSLPQFEKGSIATSFDYRPYGTELALCQRYYFKWNMDNGAQAIGCAFSSTSVNSQIFSLPVEMRSTPTMIFPTVGNSTGQITFLTSSGIYPAGSSGSTSINDISTTGYSFYMNVNLSSYNAGDGLIFWTTGASSIQASAEL